MYAVAQRKHEQMDADLGDVAELYERRAALLVRVVRRGVSAPEPVIEDACQVAWSRLIDRRDRVGRDTALAWLVTTAVHEAFRLTRCWDRERSLEELLDEAGELPGGRAAPSAAEVFDRRAQLQALRSLPQRQRQLVWLQGLGLSYAEMARETGATVRTVDRQLTRARRRLAQAGGDSAADPPPQA